MFFITAVFLHVQTAFSQELSGVWRTEKGQEGGFVEVTFDACDAALCGMITKAYAADGKPNPTYEFLGRKIVWGLQKTPEKAGYSGEIWAPDSGKTYTARIVPEAGELIVSGCIAGGFLCRSQHWTPVR